jgi:hypothetical protein
MLQEKWQSQLRCKNGLPWNLIPWLSLNTITAISPYVYVPPEVYKNVQSNEPNVHYLAMLAHEFVHIERENAAGILKWMFLYIFSAEFRVEEEIIADKASMVFLANKGLEFDIERRAKMLSSWLYFKPISYEDAKERFEQLWEEVKSLANC